MAELKYAPVPHDQKAFPAKARARKGFIEAYDALDLEHQVAGQMLQARSRAGLTQDGSRRCGALQGATIMRTDREQMTVWKRSDR